MIVVDRGMRTKRRRHLRHGQLAEKVPTERLKKRQKPSSRYLLVYDSQEPNTVEGNIKICLSVPKNFVGRCSEEIRTMVALTDKVAFP